MKRLLLKLASWLIGFAVLVLRTTCRIHVHNDPRPALTAAGTGHVFAMLHAHLIGASMSADPGTGAMVSRSTAGEIIIPALRVGGHIPIRGSSGRAKGGATALQALIEHVRGGQPAILAIDGPRGPRGNVHKGIGLLAMKSDASVLPVIAIPSRRWIISRTWDRLQIPKPFSTIDCYLAKPIFPEPHESLEQFAQRVQLTLSELEAKFDPAEGSQETDDRDTQQDLRAAA